jgi:putative ABC transport system ATP-binding protein
MTLLALEHVQSVRGAGHGLRVLLRDASFEIQPRELAVVWGLRGSGRSTLLRIAAGMEPPDGGRVRFEGEDLARHCERLLGPAIGWCQPARGFTDGQRALEYTMVGLLSHWARPAEARARARAALERVGAGHCAQMREHQLSSDEAVRVALARALALEPRLLVIDEPTRGVDLHERDGILAVLRVLANEGTAVLASTGVSTGLAEADLGLTLGEGELFAVHAPLAPVIGITRAGEPTRG